MNLTNAPTSSSGITISAVGLSPDSALSVLDAGEAAGFGLRQYPTVDSLLESASPSTQGCVILATERRDDTVASVERIQAHFHTIPVIALQKDNSAETAVELMRLGVYSVIAEPLIHQKLVSLMTTAVEHSVASQGTLDSFRESSLRLNEATEKEREVLELVLQGRKNREIADLLGITVRAVEDRRFRLMKKAGVESVAELVALAVTARYYEQGFAARVSRPVVRGDFRGCVRAIEVWTPSADDVQLELSQSCYRDAQAFQAASQGMTFRRGEGLPGVIWEKRAPAFLKELITSEFVRTGAAGADGVTAAIGFPVFSNERVSSVVLILLDGRQQLKAAFESWRMDPQTDALRLMSGTYINCESLRRLSEFVHLPIGQGLPGAAAEHGRPIVSSRFSDDQLAVRGLALTAEQFISGIVLPLTDSGSVDSDVFVLFNGSTTPVFPMIQIWKANGTGFKLAAEYVDGVPSLAAQMSRARSADDSIAHECQRTGMPVVAANGHAERIVHSPTAPAPSFAVAIPTLISGHVVAVTVLAN